MATARRVPPKSSKPVAKVSSGYHGSEGRRKMEEEQERQAARRELAQNSTMMPFRFFTPVGETRELVVIDEVPNFFRFEHNLKDPRTKKWSTFCACLAENANCPACKVAERGAYFAMYLTVIDLTPYESEKHGTVEWSKKLLVVKSAQQKKFTRLADKHGSMRGMVLSMTRDGEKDASIGNDIEFVEFMEEEELVTYETTVTYERDGKKTEKEIIGHEVFDYDELFPMPTEQQLRAIVGGHAEPGSREEAENTVGRRGGKKADDWDEDAGPARTRANLRTPRRAEPEEEAAEEEPPVRTRRAAAPPPAPARGTRPASRSPEPEEEPEEELDEEEPPPVSRRAAPPASRAPASRAAPARRAAEPEDDEDPPQRSAQSLADRRRQLRR